MKKKKASLQAVSQSVIIVLSGAVSVNTVPPDSEPAVSEFITGKAKLPATVIPLYPLQSIVAFG